MSLYPGKSQIVAKYRADGGVILGPRNRLARLGTRWDSIVGYFVGFFGPVKRPNQKVSARLGVTAATPAFLPLTQDSK